MTLERTAFLFRTHEISWQVLDMMERFKSGLSKNVFLVCDESNGPLETGGLPKISLSPSRVESWGFSKVPGDWGWLCGDYCYYAALKEHPGYEYYCLIESDVYLGNEGIAACGKLLSDCDSIAMAADLRRYETPPRFSKGLAEIGVDPHFGCIFPFTRAHRDLIPEMFGLRERVQIHAPAPRINDEAVFSAAAHLSGKALTDLYDFEDVFRKDCFATNPPHLLETITGKSNTRLAHHPVVSLSQVLTRISTGEKNYSRHRLRRVLGQSTEHVRQALDRAQAQASSSTTRTKPDGKNRFGRTERLARLLNVLKDFKPLRIVDVGANPIEGEVSYAHLLRCGQADVIGFEPNELACEELRQAASDHEQYFCRALGNGEKGKLNLTRQSGFSSLFSPDQASAEYLGFQRGMTVTRTVDVETARLDDLEQVPQIDFLKIDIQGSELDVFSNGRNKLSQALVVQTEVRFFPIYENEPSFGDLERELREQGLYFLGFDSLKRVSPNTPSRQKLRGRAFTQVVDGDAFFVRDLRTVRTLSNEQISKLCVLADNVMGSFDLAGMCIDILAERGVLSWEDAEAYFQSVPDQMKR